MSVSFNVHLSDYRTLKYLSKPCFAAVNGATHNISHARLDYIEYLPFMQCKWDGDANKSIEKISMNESMDWDRAGQWWDYLLSLPYFANMVADRPDNHYAMQHGFKIRCNAPSDRVMLALFMFRAPQFQAGIVNTWCHIVDKFKCSKDVAFVLAFALNNTNYGARGYNYPDKDTYLQRFNPSTDEESSIIYPGYFSYTGAKLMLNRLLGDDFDTLMYAGEQEVMSNSNAYHRFPIRNKKALGRFFAKKQGCSYSTGNLQCIINNDILKLPPVKRHWQLHHQYGTNYILNDDQMRELIAMMEE